MCVQAQVLVSSIHMHSCDGQPHLLTPTDGASTPNSVSSPSLPLGDLHGAEEEYAFLLMEAIRAIIEGTLYTCTVHVTIHLKDLNLFSNNATYTYSTCTCTYLPHAIQCLYCHPWNKLFCVYSQYVQVCT